MEGTSESARAGLEDLDLSLSRARLLKTPSLDTLLLTPPRSNPGTPPANSVPANDHELSAMAPFSPSPDEPIARVLSLSPPALSPPVPESLRCSAGALPGLGVDIAMPKAMSRRPSTQLLPGVVLQRSPPPALPPLEDPDLVQALAGVGGQVLSTTLLYPLAVLKTRAQTAGVGAAIGDPAADTSLSGMVSDIMAHDGVAGLYHGMGGEMIKESFNRFIYFYIYAFCKLSPPPPPPRRSQTRTWARTRRSQRLPRRQGRRRR